MSKPNPSPLVKIILQAASRGRAILAAREKAARQMQVEGAGEKSPRTVEPNK